MALANLAASKGAASLPPIASIAQWIERRSTKPGDSGSTPDRGAKLLANAMKDLIERLAAATEGSRELDAAIWLAVTREKDPEEFIEQARNFFGREPSDAFKTIHRDAHAMALANPARYTTSLDAAMTLLPKGWKWRHYLSPGAATPALALCIAALLARQADDQPS